MAPVKLLDAPRASCAEFAQISDDSLSFGDFEAELRRLSAANDELLNEFQPHDHDLDHDNHPIADDAPVSADADEMEMLRMENAELRLRVQELEALSSGQGEELWLERQREYEMLLEEKSEVIRTLHSKMQELQESPGPSTPTSQSVNAGVGQAEEILRLKRELEERSRQMDQDESDMMDQMRQMELQMAKERAEMARQRQEMQRLKSDLDREIETNSRDPQLRERLQTLARPKTVASIPQNGVKPATPPGNERTTLWCRRWPLPPW